MKRDSLFCLATCACLFAGGVCGGAAFAEKPVPPVPPGMKNPIVLWEGAEMPHTEGMEKLTEGPYQWGWSNVTCPRMFYFPAKEKGPRPTLLVCPGGGYWLLTYKGEGTKIAEWANSLGMNAFVLFYRVVQDGSVSDNPLGACADAARALELIRANAAKWNVDPKAVGMIGFSAGANLTARTCCGKVKPDFGLTIYPCGTEHAINVANNHPFSVKDWVRPDATTPPIFIEQAQDDPVRVEASLAWYVALLYAKVPTELHLFAKGGHGYGLATDHHDGTEEWPALAEKWMARVIAAKTAKTDESKKAK